MRELDLLLAGWLERCWEQADGRSRADFERLLDRSDPEIAAWLFGGARPPDASLRALVDDILRGPARA